MANFDPRDGGGEVKGHLGDLQGVATPVSPRATRHAHVRVADSLHLRDSPSNQAMLCCVVLCCVVLCCVVLCYGTVQHSQVVEAIRPTGHFIVQELRESRGGRPGLSVLTSLLVSMDVKLY